MKFLSSEKLSAHKYKTPEGYLVCTDAILARTGKQQYKKSEVFANCQDDSMIDVDRQADEVFSPETLASFENKPITVEHPDENVTADNHNRLAVGFVRDVRRGTSNGQEVMLGNLVITDKQTIEEIENGEHTDLSCGYDCDIQDEGNPQQRHIRGNHVALCQQGRAGIARIVDSAIVDDRLTDAVKVGQRYKTRTGYIYEIIKLGQNVFGTPAVFYKDINDIGAFTNIQAIEHFENEVREGIFTKISDSINDSLDDVARIVDSIKDGGITSNDIKVGATFYKLYNNKKVVEVLTVFDIGLDNVKTKSRFYVIDKKTNIYELGSKGASVFRTIEQTLESAKQNLTNTLNNENFVKNKPNVILKDSAIEDSSDYIINFRNNYAGFREKTFVKANSAIEALKEFSKEVALRGWGTRNVDIISISPNDGNMRLYGNLFELLNSTQDSMMKDAKLENIDGENIIIMKSKSEIPEDAKYIDEYQKDGQNYNAYKGLSTNRLYLVKDSLKRFEVSYQQDGVTHVNVVRAKSMEDAIKQTKRR